MKIVDRLGCRIYQNDKWWYDKFKKMVSKHRTVSNALKELVISYDESKVNAPVAKREDTKVK